MKPISIRLFLCGTIALGVGLPPNALAQGIEEVIVTARQREEAISDVPASITAFSSDVIDRAKIERAEDFIALTPGVAMVDTAEVGDTQVSIRGINTTRDAEANFAFIVDGILYTNPSAFNREFANLKQIEILKGPQGALYGRSASAGAIIVTTQKPSNEFHGDIKLSAGSQETYYVSASGGGPLVQDQLYGSIHVDYRDSEGFFKNQFLNNKKVVDNFENYNVSGRLVWEPREDVSFDMRAHYGEVDSASITFNAAFALADASGNTPSPFYEDVNAHRFVFQPNLIPTNEQESKDVSFRFDWDMGWADLTGWFLYSDIEQDFFADGTSGAFGFFATDPPCVNSLATLFAQGVTLPAPQILGPTFATSFLGPYTPTACDGYQYQIRNQEDKSFEVRLSSPGDQQLRWQLGFYYLDLEREVGVSQLRDDGNALPKSLVNPLTEALVHDEFNTEVFAVFGNVQYDIREDLEVSLAIRYDREDREASSKVPPPSQQRSVFVDYTIAALGCDDGLPGSPLNPGYVDFANCVTNNSLPSRNEVFDEVQPKVSIRWDARDNLALFASWGRGFKSGGFNNHGSQATIDLFFNNPAVGAGLSIRDRFEKETSDAFEVGFKSTIAGGQVRLEGALFHTMVDDMQVFNFFVGPFGLLRVVSNIDEASITGGELAASVDFNDNWTFFGGVGITNGIIDKNRNRPQTVGNKIPYTPDYTYNLGAEFFEENLFMGADLIVRVDYNTVGPTWFSEVQKGDLTPGLFTPAGFGLNGWSLTQRESFSTVNARFGFQTETWGLHAFVKNLTDEKYLEEVIPAPEFGGSFIHPGNRRAWGLEATYRF